MTDTKNKYLTDMKELPPESVAEDISEVKIGLGKEFSKKEDQLRNKNTTKNLIETEKDVEHKESVNQEFDEDYLLEDDDIKPYTSKDIILGIINFLCVSAIVFLLVKFPQKSLELKNERQLTLLNDSSFSYELSKVELGKKKADQIKKHFVDDSGVASFLNELEILETGSGLIKKISFTNQKAIEDKSTGLYGIPVIIEFSGNLSKIIEELEIIQKLPFVLRAITVESEKNNENPDMVDFKYGAMLYVDDTFK